MAESAEQWAIHENLLGVPAHFVSEIRQRPFSHPSQTGSFRYL